MKAFTVLQKSAKTAAPGSAPMFSCPDHLHLFVALDDRELLLDRWMKSLKNALSKTLRSHGAPTPHWQKGFFDHLLRSDESYEEKWLYVRENPVRAGLVIRWQDWPYGGEIFPLDYTSE